MNNVIDGYLLRLEKTEDIYEFAHISSFDIIEKKEKKPCEVAGCEALVLRELYCSKHLSKIKKGRRPEIDYRSFGRNTTKYPNRKQIILVKKERLKKANNSCEDCNIVLPESKLHLHHLDGSTDNHSKENCIVVCPKCHKGSYHSGHKRGPSKKFNGLNCSAIARLIGCSAHTVTRQLLHGRRSENYGDKIEALASSPD